MSRRRQALPIAVASVGAAMLAAIWGVGEWQADAATARLEKAAAHSYMLGDALPSAVRDEAVAALAAAAARDPRNARIHERLARAHASPVRHDVYTAADWQAAIAAQQRVLALRPTAPQAWADLAWYRYQAGDTGDRFRQALINATRFGPWQPAVNAIVADLGLAVWDELPADARASVGRSIGRMARRQADEALNAAKNRGRLATICGLEEWVALPACRSRPE